MTDRTPARLGPALSIYLDALRAAASLAVFAGHAKVLLFATSRLGPLFGQSREAVAVFFVLSGFTIRFVSVEKERDWRDYAAARASRLYSVAPLALLVTWGLDRAGSHWNPDFYASLGFLRPETLAAALRCLSFTNELWTTHAVFGADEPYWSLGFEVPYYLAFGLALFTRGTARAALLCVWLAACGPKIAAYLPLWLIGVAAYEAQARWTRPWPRRRLLAGLAATFAAYVAVWTLLGKSTGDIYEHVSWPMTLRNLLYFHLIGSLVAANIVLFAGLTASWSGPGARPVRIVRWCAGASFTLYLTHQPVLAFLSSLLPGGAEAPAALRVACCLAALAAVAALAELGERRKRWFSRRIRALAGLPPAGPAATREGPDALGRLT